MNTQPTVKFVVRFPWSRTKWDKGVFSGHSFEDLCRESVRIDGELDLSVVADIRAIEFRLTLPAPLKSFIYTVEKDDEADLRGILQDFEAEIKGNFKQHPSFVFEVALKPELPEYAYHEETTRQRTEIPIV